MTRLHLAPSSLGQLSLLPLSSVGKSSGALLGAYLLPAIGHCSYTGPSGGWVRFQRSGSLNILREFFTAVGLIWNNNGTDQNCNVPPQSPI